MTGTIHEDQHTVLAISRSVNFGIRNVPDKMVEKIKTHILYSVTFLPPGKFVQFMRCGKT